MQKEVDLKPFRPLMPISKTHLNLRKSQNRNLSELDLKTPAMFGVDTFGFAETKTCTTQLKAFSNPALSYLRVTTLSIG
jgi:hypothetical protein